MKWPAKVLLSPRKRTRGASLSRKSSPARRSLIFMANAIDKMAQCFMSNSISLAARRNQSNGPPSFSFSCSVSVFEKENEKEKENEDEGIIALRRKRRCET